MRVATTILLPMVFASTSLARPSAEPARFATTLDDAAELARPLVQSWRSWIADTEYDDDGEALPATPIPDGAYRKDMNGVVTTGTFANGRMEGSWTRTDADGNVIGVGGIL